MFFNGLLCVRSRIPYIAVQDTVSLGDMWLIFLRIPCRMFVLQLHLLRCYLLYLQTVEWSLIGD